MEVPMLDYEDMVTAQMAERIAELEAYNTTRTDELLAATRRISKLEAENAKLQEALQLIKDGSTPAKFLAGLALKGASAR